MIKLSLMHHHLNNSIPDEERVCTVLNEAGRLRDEPIAAKAYVEDQVWFLNCSPVL